MAERARLACRFSSGESPLGPHSLKRHTLYTCLVQTVRSVLRLSNSRKGWSVICLLSVPSNAMKALALRRLAGTTVILFVLACVPTFEQVAPQPAGIYADQNGTLEALSTAA